MARNANTNRGELSSAGVASLMLARMPPISTVWDSSNTPRSTKHCKSSTPAARAVLVEGGAGVASGCMNAGLVYWVQVYQAPLLLGEGISVLAHPLTNTLKGAARFSRGQVVALGDDLLINYVRVPRNASPHKP